MSLIAEFLPGALIEGFTANTRLAVPYLQSLARTTRTQSSIFAELRSAGLKFRDSEARVVIRAERAAMQGANVINALTRSTPIQPDLMTEAITPIRKNFSHVIKVTGTDLFTGAPVNQWVTVSTNNVLSRAEVFDAAQQAIEFGAGFTSATISNTMTDLGFEYERGLYASGYVPGA